MDDIMKIDIRLATKDDVKSIKDIVKQAFQQYCNAIGLHTIEALSESEEQIFEDMKHKQVYVAYYNGIPVGSIRLQILNDKAFISRFSILPMYQSLGIGGMILSFIDKILESTQIESVELYSAVENTQLINFYERNGYHVVSVDTSRGYQRGLLRKTNM